MGTAAEEDGQAGEIVRLGVLATGLDLSGTSIPRRVTTQIVRLPRGGSGRSQLLWQGSTYQPPCFSRVRALRYNDQGKYAEDAEQVQRIQ